MGCSVSKGDFVIEACGIENLILTDLEKEQSKYRKRFNEQHQQQKQGDKKQLPKIVRKDLSANLNTFHMAKNSIVLVNVDKKLIQLIQQSGLCTKDQFAELVNAMATRKNIYAKPEQEQAGHDEASYCKFLAEILLRNTGIVAVIPLKLLLEILQVFKDLNVKEAFWYDSSKMNQKNWFERYSSVLISQLVSLIEYVELVVTLSREQSLIQKTELYLFSVVIFSIRFLVGINWGYSDQLPHHDLDEEMEKLEDWDKTNQPQQMGKEKKSFIVMFNIMQKFKQAFRSHAVIGTKICELESVENYFFSQSQFRICPGFGNLDQLVTFDTYDPSVQHQCCYTMKQGREYLENPIYINFYRKLKVTLDNWLSKNAYENDSFENITQKELDHILFLNQQTYQQDYLHQLRIQSDGVVNKTKAFELKIENSKSIFVLNSSGFESQIVFESFLQEHSKPNPRYKCILQYVCVKQNKITLDTYYILKNIVYQLSRIKAIKDFLLLQKDNTFKELINKESTSQSQFNFQEANAHTFIEFLKVIRQVKLDYNLAVFIHGLENIYNQSDLENFVLVLRSASIVMPTYLKFVVSVERRQMNFALIDKTLKLLMSRTVETISDDQYWKTEAKDLIAKVLGDNQSAVILKSFNDSYKNLCCFLTDVSKVGLEKVMAEYMDKGLYLTQTIRLNTKIEQKPHTVDFLRLMCCFYGPIEISELWWFPIQRSIVNESMEFYQDHVLFYELEHEYGTDKIHMCALRDQKQMKQALKMYSDKRDSNNFLTNSEYFYSMILYQNSRGLPDPNNTYNNFAGDRLFTTWSVHYQMNFFHYLRRLKINAPKIDVYQIYRQLLLFRSFNRLLLNYHLNNSVTQESPEHIRMLVNLRLIGQTYQSETNPTFNDFYTQMKARNFATHYIMRYNSFARFEPKHASLRENQRVEHTIQFPPSPILSCKFLSDNQRVVFSLACGLCLLLDTVSLLVQKVFVNSCICLDLIKVVDDKYLILAGLSEKVRIFSLDTEKLVTKFQPHTEASYVNLIQIGKGMFFSYSSYEIVKWSLKKKERLAKIQTTAPVLKMKLRHNGIITCLNTNYNFIVMFDLELNLMFQADLNEQPINIQKFLSLSRSDCLVFSRDGSFVVLNTEVMLEEVKRGTVFSLKSEDYLDILLIKSKENYLFTIERQKMDFFQVTNFKKSDSWDYFLPRAISGCDKNKEGSKICVWDTNSTLCLFNFLKQVDQSYKESLPPSHRRQDQIQCLDATENNLVTVSLDRELRVWNPETGAFVKKFDLTSFTNETLISIKLTESGMLFLGSKDMNVYLIDISKGKLCVVYEGHWSRVNLIKQVENKDLLLTVSESNIKIWDLEYDECIKNMNEHTSPVVYCDTCQHNKLNIVTISQDYEYKEWSYTTGQVTKSLTLNLPNDTHLVAVDINQDGIAFFALESNDIVIYCLKKQDILASQSSHQNEDVIFLKFQSTPRGDYLFVVTRTSCILYILMDEAMEKVSSYVLNCSKTQKQFSQIQSKFSYSSRFYFTTCKLLWRRVKIMSDQEYTRDVPVQNQISSYQLLDKGKIETMPKEFHLKEEHFQNNAFDTVPKQIAVDEKIQEKQLAQRNQKQKRFGTAQPKNIEQPFESIEITDYCSLNKEEETTPLVIDEILETQPKNEDQTQILNLGLLTQIQPQKEITKYEKEYSDNLPDLPPDQEYNSDFDSEAAKFRQEVDKKDQEQEKDVLFIYMGDSRGILHMLTTELI